MEEGLVTVLTLGMGTQATAVDGFARQRADLVNIAPEPDAAVPDHQAGGQAGSSGWDLTRIDGHWTTFALLFRFSL
jgi:hypothetical protein